MNLGVPSIPSYCRKLNRWVHTYALTYIKYSMTERVSNKSLARSKNQRTKDLAMKLHYCKQVPIVYQLFIWSWYTCDSVILGYLLLVLALPFLPWLCNEYLCGGSEPYQLKKYICLRLLTCLYVCAWHVFLRCLIFFISKPKKSISS